MRRQTLSEVEMYTLLAKNLSYLRKHRGRLSQKALARILHLPPKTIMNYENCRTTPLAYAVLILADYYGCSVEDLLTRNLTERNQNIE